MMKRAGHEMSIPVIDLNSASVEYYNEIGIEATTAVFMSIEAGETPGKSNDGSFANGHPSNKIDGTHYKEALSKQFARMVVTRIERLGAEGDSSAAEVASYLKAEVRKAIASNDWSQVYPEIAKDTMTGVHAHYRNQIEKLLQLGIMSKEEDGNFHPERPATVSEFVIALCKAMRLNPTKIAEYSDGDLSRETMGAILYDAYHAKFVTKPKYMTDYNGTALTPDDAGYDPNLDSGAKGVMFYPVVSFDQLTDVHLVSPAVARKLRDAYELGLLRSEKGIARGWNGNGTELEPKTIVTRAKAAKTLYFMWVLTQPVLAENDGV
ncbi:S-layer homology domain-containing protein [Paenibacillus sp.]|uniref:S-layer homology domain-containing protein n=1 Tax=Paenibacillus sp. TaxID=58172 RepID=UPI0028113467|nr:S-layer homology domain-containing protein [Paenibacillus sp.]